MKAKNKLPIWLIVLSFLWIVCIIFFYFVDFKKVPTATDAPQKASFQLEWRQSHLYYAKAVEKLVEIPGVGIKKIKLNPLVSVLLIVLCLGIVLPILMKNYIDKDSKLKISPIVWIVIAFFLTLLMAVFWKSFFVLRDPIIYNTPFFKIGKSFMEILIIGLPVIALGKSIKNRFLPERDDYLLEFLYSVGFGIGAMIFFLFFLGLFGILTRNILASLFVFIIVANYRNVYFWLKALWSRKIEIKIFGSVLTWGLILVVLIVFAQNVLEATRPMPVGHDELEMYANTTNLIAQNARLIHSSSLPYLWELFRAMPLILFGSQLATNFLSSLAGLLAFLGLYKLADNYCKIRLIEFNRRPYFYPLLVATIFYALPMVVFQSAVDLKVDLVAFFAAALSFILFLDWKKIPQAKNLLLYLAFYFAGLAFAVKITSAYYLLVLAAMTLMVLVSKKINIRILFGTLAVAFAVFFISFAPFAIKNIIQNRSISLSSIVYGHSSNPGIEIDENSEGYKLIAGKALKNNTADLTRFSGNEVYNLYNLMSLPFVATFNSSVSGQFVDVGYVYLAIIPIILILIARFLIRKEKINNNFVLVVTGSLLFWFAWIVSSKGIIWYGITGFLFLSILLVEVLFYLKSASKILYIFTCTMIGFWLFFSLSLRTVYDPALIHTLDETQTGYISGSLSDDQTKQAYFSGYKDIQDLNSRISESKDFSHQKVYVVGKYYTYFINNNDDLVTRDQFTTFGMIFLPNKNVVETVAKFKEAGYKYVVISNVSGVIYGDKTLISLNNLGNEFVRNNPDQIKILNPESVSGVVIAEFK